MSRSLNKVELIGNLTRDPELRYTPTGTAVCTFGLATNRQWNTESGEKKEDTEFHRIVSWNKLAELCAQLLAKGRKVFVEGRLQTRKWTGQDNIERTTTEIVISDMIILDSRGSTVAPVEEFNVPDEIADVAVSETGVTSSGDDTKPKSGSTSAVASDNKKTTTGKSVKVVKEKKPEEKTDAAEESDDIPF